MMTKEEVAAILRRSLDTEDTRKARREAISRGDVISLDAERERDSPDFGSGALKTYPADHPVILVRGLHWSLGQLRLLSEAMHDGWASQVLLDHLDESIDILEHVEDVLGDVDEFVNGGA